MKKRKTILIKLTALAALAALLFCMAGCSGENTEATSSEIKTNKNADGTYFDNGETFCRGVWASDDGEKRVGYYIFYDGENGKFSDAQLGMEVPFKVRVNKETVDFALGAADFTDPTTVENVGEGKRTLTWTNENRVENLVLLTEQEPDSFSYFTRNDLSEMALDYYETQKGERPVSADVVVGADGMALITLSGKNGRELAVYEVDSLSGKGTVKGTDKEVQLERSTEDD